MPGLMITYVNGIPCSLTIIVSTITACSSAGLSSAGSRAVKLMINDTVTNTLYT